MCRVHRISPLTKHVSVLLVSRTTGIDLIRTYVCNLFIDPFAGFAFGRDSFVSQEVCVSGDLVPFDEVSVAFRGPLNLYNIAWYEGTADETLERTTTWTQGYVNIFGRSFLNTTVCNKLRASLLHPLPILAGLKALERRREVAHPSTCSACRVKTHPLSQTPPKTHETSERPEKTLPS